MTLVFEFYFYKFEKKNASIITFGEDKKFSGNPWKFSHKKVFHNCFRT